MSLVYVATPIDEEDDWIEACSKLLHQQIISNSINFGAAFFGASDAKDFILGLLRKDPDARRNIDDCLNHPFLKIPI